MDDKFAINIGRQLGSGGKAVGEMVAQRLGIEIYDRKLIDLAMRRSGMCREVFETADEQQPHNRMATIIAYLRAPFMNDAGTAANPLSSDALFKIQSDVIRAVAEQQSAVFVGRCADYVLREHPRTLNIFITGGERDRIERIRAREGCSEAEARQRMTRGDAHRASYYNYYSSRTWGAASSYDLCINTSVLGIEAAAELVLEVAARKFDLKL